MLRALLLIVPVGAFIGRVKRGIDLTMNTHSDLTSGSDVMLKLVVSKEYSATDPEYVSKFVDEVERWIGKDWTQKNAQSIKIQRESLNVTDRNECTCWLIEQIGSFFKKYSRNSLALIDLTSAPREWLFVAIDLASMFDNVNFYNVPPGTRSLPSGFKDSEIEDTGARLEYVFKAKLSAPLKYWACCTDEEGYPTEHSVLFRTMWELLQTRGDKYSFDDVGELFRSNCLRVYDDALEKAEKSKAAKERDLKKELARRRGAIQSIQLEDVKKKISRFFTDIDSYKLFGRSLGTPQFTEKGKARAKSLFG